MTIRHALTSSGRSYRYYPAELDDVSVPATVCVVVPRDELERAARCASRWLLVAAADRLSGLLRLAAGNFSHAALRDAERELVDAVRLADTLTVRQYREVRGVVATLQRVTAVRWA